MVNLTMESGPSVAWFGGQLADAATVNLTLTVLAFPLAIVVAALIALLRSLRVPLLGLVLGAYVDAIRMTPLLLHLFFVFFGLPLLGVTLTAKTAAVLTMGLHFGAYQSEVFRAAFSSVPRGIREAADVIGMRGVTLLHRVTGPLALRVAIPPTTNTLIELFRGTAIVSLVAVQDILFKGTLLIQTNRGSSPVVFTLVALFFVAVCYPAGQLVRVLERRFAIL
jgi:polar amino acid transport system permease protein